MMNKQAYPFYRWYILSTFMLLTIVIEIQWLTHAPIARAAQVFYKGQINPDSIINIDFLALSYMLVFLIVCIPASYFIDKYGIRKGVGLGAILTIAGTLVKAGWGSSFQMVLAGQLILAVAQPFILNAVTAVSVRWFPVEERATAAGLSSLAQFIGIVIAMVVTPTLIVSEASRPDYGSGIDHMLIIYAIPTIIASVLLLLVFREHPKGMENDASLERYQFTKGIRHIFKLKDMWLTILLFTIGLGMFNAISSMVDSISAYLKIDDSDGLIGGIMLIGGIIGAIILPILSDKYRKRKMFLIICMIGTVPAVAGLAFAAQLTGGAGVNPEAAYKVALISSFILGFFIMSAGPIGFQYAAEVSAPAPESTSQGLLLLAGQISGIIIVIGMSIRNNQFLGAWLIAFLVLSIINVAGVLMIKESPVFRKEQA